MSDDVRVFPKGPKYGDNYDRIFRSKALLPGEVYVLGPPEYVGEFPQPKEKFGIGMPQKMAPEEMQRVRPDFTEESK